MVCFFTTSHLFWHLTDLVDSVCSVVSHVPALCDPMDCSLLGSSIHGIFQARTLEWVAITFSKGSSQPRDQTHISCLLHWQAGSLPADPPGRSYLFHLNVDVSVRVNCSHASSLASLILTALREDISLDHTGCP